MTQPGETDGYTVSDHIKAINKVRGEKLLDSVLVNQTYIFKTTLEKIKYKYLDV